MGIFSFLRSSNQPTPDLFEKELVQLEVKIQNHQEKLKLIDQRQRSTTSTITIYSSLFWLIYSSLWYFGWTLPLKWINRNQKILPSSRFPFLSDSKFNQSLQVLPIILIPIGLLCFRWLVQTWYQRKQESEKLRLRSLQKQLRDKVEELKKKTAYYSTKELLDRYDEKTKPLSSPHSQSQPARMTMTPPNNEALRQRHRPPSSSPANMPNSASPMQVNTSSPAHQSGPFSAPLNHQPQLHDPKMFNTPSPSGGRGWADRFAEVLLGDDEARPESKYALICIKCFAHNGLVRQEELDQIQYLCPKCGTFNPSRTKGVNQNRPSANDRLSVEGAAEGKTGSLNNPGQVNRGGRKSLADSMFRRQSQSDNDTFHVTDKRRVASHGIGPPSTFSTSLSAGDNSSPVSPPVKSVEEEVQDGDPDQLSGISQADPPPENDQLDETLEANSRNSSPPHPVDLNARDSSQSNRKSKKKSN